MAVRREVPLVVGVRVHAPAPCPSRMRVKAHACWPVPPAVSRRPVRYAVAPKPPVGSGHMNAARRALNEKVVAPRDTR